MVSKHRLEALSDGIFAIAMTLLVLDLKVPEGHITSFAAFKPDGSVWVTFAITFFIAARFWILQHDVLASLEQLEPETTVSTIGFLCFVTLLPFSTSLWGKHIADSFTFLVYCLNQFALSAILVYQFEVAAIRRHLLPQVARTDMRRRLYTFSAAMAAGIACSFFMPIRWAGVLPAVIAFGGRHSGDTLLHRTLVKTSHRLRR